MDSTDLLDQYGIDTSSKLAAYMSSDYLKDENKYGIYDFSMFFHDLGIEVDFETRKEGELLVRYFLAALAAYVMDGQDVNYQDAAAFARSKTDEMMVKLGIPKKIPVPFDDQGKKKSLKDRAIQMYRENPNATNPELIDLFVKGLKMSQGSAIVYASNVKHKWKDK